MANEHLGSAAKVEAPQPATATPGVTTAPKQAVDNETQATLAEHQREFTTGGGSDAASGADAASGVDPTTVLQALARATERVRAPDRPSPFGVSQFPPLPEPPPRRRPT